MLGDSIAASERIPRGARRALRRHTVPRWMNRQPIEAQSEERVNLILRHATTARWWAQLARPHTDPSTEIGLWETGPA